MRLLQLPAFLSLLAFASALPKPAPRKSLPLLIWHGLGDKHDADGLHSVGELAQRVNPGTYVYYIRVDDDSGKDRTGTFFGNITAQSEAICTAITQDEFLADQETGMVRADALGFSQGGQFLRGLVERCDNISIRSLVTFGSQHNGIAKFQECGTWDLICKGAVALVRGNVWGDYVQNTVVPAQYYREINETTGLGTDEYVANSHFLADINNERQDKNAVYAKRLSSLEQFVMYVFEEDKTVIPKESGWFAEVNATSGDVTRLQDRPIYKEDWIGLKTLDKKGGLVFKTAPGGHMALEEEVLADAFSKYFGPERTASSMVDPDSKLQIMWRNFRQSAFSSAQKVLAWRQDL